MQQGPNYPSALGGLRGATQPPRSLPVLVIGAGAADDVVPEDANYRWVVGRLGGWAVGRPASRVTGGVVP